MSAAPSANNAMIKALARASRWRRLLEDGTHRTMEELAAAEGINASYVNPEWDAADWHNTWQFAQITSAGLEHAALSIS
jgi:hypothetical protein